MEIIIHECCEGDWIEVFVDGTRFYRNHSMRDHQWRELLKMASGKEIDMIRLYSEAEEKDGPEMNAFNDALARGEKPPLPSFTEIVEGEYNGKS